MKFLCVTCDEAMKLTRTVGPEHGSLTVVFGCPTCGKETAMLTNAMETQMVRSLGVKVGGKTVKSEPMEMVRNSLSQGGDVAPDENNPHGHHPPTGSLLDSAVESMNSGEPKCPFTGVVADAYEKMKSEQPTVVWTKEAEERMARIPDFAQPMVKKGVELHALEKGYTEINEEVMDEVKGRFGM